VGAAGKRNGYPQWIRDWKWMLQNTGGDSQAEAPVLHFLQIHIGKLL
jgi:hypothetical protein